MTSGERPTVSLAHLGSVKVGFAFPSEGFVADRTRPRLLRGMNVKRGKIDWSGDNEKRWGGAENDLADYRLEANDLVIAMDGALVGRSYATVRADDLPAYLVQRVARVRAKDSRSQSYLRHLVGSREFVRYVDRVKTHTAVPHISGRNIEEFPCLNLPIAAQERLGSLFDNFVSIAVELEVLSDAKRTFKRGLMQQLLTGRKRFPEFCRRPWHLSPLSNHVDEVKRRNTSGATLVLTASGEHGLVDQRRYFNRSVAGADLSKYYLLRKGEFAYNRSAMTGYPYGATKRLDEHDEGALSTLYLCFAITDDKLDSDFLKHVFDSGVLDRQLRPIVRVGARAHGLLNVADDDFLSISIPFPELDEQNRIAELLTELNREIDLLAAQREKVEDYRRALLSKLLSGSLPLP